MTEASLHGESATTADEARQPPPILPPPAKSSTTANRADPQHGAARRTLAKLSVVLRPPGTEVVHLLLGRWAFCACWWLVLFFHIFLGGFAFGVTVLHRYLQKDGVNYSISALNVPMQTLQITAYMFLLVGLAHCIAIVRMIRNSLRAGELTLHTSTKISTLKRIHSRPSMPQRFNEVIKMIWDMLFSPTGFFGFSGWYFEAVFICREVVEIVMQTYQAYKLSQSVPRKWINQLAVAAIVLNCGSSPLVHMFCRKNESLRRVLSLLLDALLDFCSSVVIPLCVILPYAYIYDPTTKSVPSELLADDVWFVNAVSEMRQVLVTSVPDFVSSFMPQISLLGYLVTFKNILRRRSARVHDQVDPVASHETSRDIPASTEPKNGPSLDHETLSGKLRRVDPAANKPINIAQLLRRDPKRFKHWLSILVHLMFLGWGCAVLALHLDAFHNTDRSIPGCKLHVSAWHSAGFPCSVMKLNCHHYQLDGSVDQTTAVLDLLARSSLQVLIFSHCQNLYIPPVVAEFTDLVGLELFNSTIADWPVEAAIREATQPHLGYVYFILSNWTSFPAGLLHDHLPHQLKHFSIVANNLTELPDNIDVWRSHKWITFNLDRAPFLATLPDAFCRVQMDHLWLPHSGLASFSRACVDGTGVKELILSGGSAVDTLPDLAGTKHLHVLAAEHTSVTSLPTGFHDWYSPSREAYFYGSPVCDAPELRNATELWSQLCAVDVASASGLYSWSTMLPLRPYD